MTPGAGQQLAPCMSTSSTPSDLKTSLEALSIPGYLRGMMHPRKNAYFAILLPSSLNELVEAADGRDLLHFLERLRVGEDRWRNGLQPQLASEGLVLFSERDEVPGLADAVGDLPVCLGHVSLPDGHIPERHDYVHDLDASRASLVACEACGAEP